MQLCMGIFIVAFVCASQGTLVPKEIISLPKYELIVFFKRKKYCVSVHLIVRLGHFEGEMCNYLTHII